MSTWIHMKDLPIDKAVIAWVKVTTPQGSRVIRRPMLVIGFGEYDNAQAVDKQLTFSEDVHTFIIIPEPSL